MENITIHIDAIKIIESDYPNDSGTVHTIAGRDDSGVEYVKVYHMPERKLVSCERSGNAYDYVKNRLGGFDATGIA
jgi:hypothetical protein